MFNITDAQKIGVGLAGMGVAFLFLGVLLLFDKGLLAIGNLLFLSGLAFLIGLEKTFFFFFQRHKIKGSVSFFSGIVVVFLGWPLVGMLVEFYGFILLFGGFLPVAINFIRRLPGLNVVLNLPGISSGAEATMFLLLAATTLMSTIEDHRKAEERLKRHRDHRQIQRPAVPAPQPERPKKKHKKRRSISSRISAVAEKIQRLYTFLERSGKPQKPLVR